MLHILTPLYRYELLEKVYKSIPPHDDITWHICKTSRRPPLRQDFVYTDPRIRLYEIDCPDNDNVIKRTYIFDQIHDGYFYLLDDDTIFLEALYELYCHYSSIDFVGMVIGDQLSPIGNGVLKATMPTEEPITTLIDSGMVLCHHKVLRHVPWTWSSIPYRDRDFWSRCGKFWGKDAIRLEHTVISVYNFYGAKIRVRKKIMGVTIKFDIYSRGLARLYVWLGKLLSNHT